MSETINILLVDDEPRNLDALEAILTEPSYRLLRADDALTRFSPRLRRIVSLASSFAG